MAVRKCVACQAEMDPDAIFCNECGLAQPVAVAPVARPQSPEVCFHSSVSCPRCNKIVVGEVRFCPDCSFDFAATLNLKGDELICPSCQKACTDNDKFCRHCAFDLGRIAKVSSATFCTGCGKPFQPSDKYCRHCAADLSGSDHTVAVPIIKASSVSQAEISVPRYVSTTSVRPQEPEAFLRNDLDAGNPTGPHWISPSAAAFVVICFFLPWIEWSCFGSSVLVSGAQLANRDASFFLFPLAAIVTILVYFIFRSQKRLSKARPYILISSAFGLLFLVYKVSSIPSVNVFGRTISASDLGFKPQVGGFGTIIGFIIAMIGCAFMGRKLLVGQAEAGGPRLSQSESVSGWFESELPIGSRSGSWFTNYLAFLKPNKAAMLCYLSPLLLPIFVNILMLVIVAFFGNLGGVIGLLLLLIAPFAGQVCFLNIEPHKSNHFVRFHAFQSLFLFGTIGAVILILAGLLSIAGFNSGF